MNPLEEKLYLMFRSGFAATRSLRQGGVCTDISDERNCNEMSE